MKKASLTIAVILILATASLLPAGTKNRLLIFPMRQFMVNTRDNALLRVKLDLIVDSTGTHISPELRKRRNDIRDIILLFFNARHNKELNTPDALKKTTRRLIRAINKELKTCRIEAIRYDEFSMR